MQRLQSSWHTLAAAAVATLRRMPQKAVEEKLEDRSALERFVG